MMTILKAIILRKWIFILLFKYSGKSLYFIIVLKPTQVGGHYIAKAHGRLKLKELGKIFP